MEEILCSAHAQLQLWTKSQQKVSLHLSSLANLTEQAETLHRCQSKSSKMGVLSQHPLYVHLLQGKLTQAMERALGFINREKEVLNEIVGQLKKYSKESQVKFKHIVERQGLVLACSGSPQTFSPCDQAYWLRQIHAAYKSALEEKLRALEELSYSSDSVREVTSVWETEAMGCNDVLSYLDYSVKVNTG